MTNSEERYAKTLARRGIDRFYKVLECLPGQVVRGEHTPLTGEPHEFTARRSAINNYTGRTCSACWREATPVRPRRKYEFEIGRPLSVEDFGNILEANELGDKFTVIEMCKDGKVRMTHNQVKDSHEVVMSRQAVLRSSGKFCGVCYGKRRITPESFKQELESRLDNRVEVMTDYKGSHELVTVRYTNGSGEVFEYTMQARLLRSLTVNTVDARFTKFGKVVN